MFFFISIARYARPLKEINNRAGNYSSLQAIEPGRSARAGILICVPPFSSSSNGRSSRSRAGILTWCPQRARGSAHHTHTRGIQDWGTGSISTLFIVVKGPGASWKVQYDSAHTYIRSIFQETAQNPNPETHTTSRYILREIIPTISDHKQVYSA